MTDTTETYLAVQAVSPGKLELTRKPMQSPAPGQVRIKIEACGVCHSDAATVEGVFPISWPRVPGHEVVGKIESLGEGVEGWSIGQRVGVGFLAGSCGHCSECRSGHLVSCRNQEFTGVHRDGGYAEWMVAKASGLMSVPDDLTDVEAAPLLCAGLTTFSALRNSGAKAGDVVAVMGIGGLGHLAVQYARGMGFEVVAIGRGPAVGELATKLGAHHYIDSAAEPVADALQRLGGADLVPATASGGKGVSDSVKGLKARGKTIVLGATAEPIELASGDLFFKERSVEGALTGDPATGDTTLRFSSLFGISAMIEEFPLERAVEAYDKMMHGKPRFRVVLTMGS
jgi:propanol-preferring alcohol dehydrogenase